MSDSAQASLWLPGTLYKLLAEVRSVGPEIVDAFRKTHLPVQEKEIALGQVPEELVQVFALGFAKALRAREKRLLCEQAIAHDDEDGAREALDASYRLEMEKNYLIDIGWRELHIQCATWRMHFTEVHIRQNDLFVIVPTTPEIAPVKKKLH